MEPPQVLELGQAAWTKLMQSECLILTEFVYLMVNCLSLVVETYEPQLEVGAGF